jgi:signal transduction histidine kinase
VLSLEISDNGRGLSADDLAKARSFGIRGLHERAATVGGWMDMSSSAAGTTLILSLPLQQPGAAGGQNAQADAQPRGPDPDDPDSAETSAWTAT